MADGEGVDLRLAHPSVPPVSDVVSGDLIELVDVHGTRVRAVVTRHVSTMAVEFAGETRVFARYRDGRGWRMARGLKIVSLQQQLWPQ